MLAVVENPDARRCCRARCSGCPHRSRLRARLNGRRCTRCTWHSARRWCRSPATRCRCSTPPGMLKEHLHTRAAAGLFDVSHMGQIAPPRSGDADASARRLETLVPVDVLGLAPGAALRAPHRRRGRHPRRPDGRQLRRPSRRSSSTPPARTPTARICGAAWPTTARRAARPRACWRCRARRRRQCWRGSRRSVAAMRFMDVRAIGGRRRACHRHALRLHRRGRLRDLASRATTPRRVAAALLAEPEVAAGRARRARLAAPRSRAVPLRPRHRHHDDARSRPGSTGRSEARRAAAPARAAFPGAARILRQTRRRRRPPARRPAARGRARRCARARRSSPTTTASPSARHLGRLRAQRRGAGRHGLRADRDSPRPARASSPRCAASACRSRSRPCPSSRTATTAADPVHPEEQRPC